MGRVHLELVFFCVLDPPLDNLLLAPGRQAYAGLGDVSGVALRGVRVLQFHLPLRHWHGHGEGLPWRPLHCLQPAHLPCRRIRGGCERLAPLDVLPPREHLPKPFQARAASVVVPNPRPSLRCYHRVVLRLLLRGLLTGQGYQQRGVFCRIACGSLRVAAHWRRRCRRIALRHCAFLGLQEHAKGHRWPTSRFHRQVRPGASDVPQHALFGSAKHAGECGLCDCVVLARFPSEDIGTVAERPCDDHMRTPILLVPLLALDQQRALPIAEQVLPREVGDCHYRWRRWARSDATAGFSGQLRGRGHGAACRREPGYQGRLQKRAPFRAPLRCGTRHRRIGAPRIVGDQQVASQ
mmetsp:Transcript_93663/g.264354  ORF Transcript_93663/g.264354 Transcript_93663/m.264354 type:complete len:351 (-) Transcript_93663:336-1388(-)